MDHKPLTDRAMKAVDVIAALQRKLNRTDLTTDRGRAIELVGMIGATLSAYCQTLKEFGMPIFPLVVTYHPANRRVTTETEYAELFDRANFSIYAWSERATPEGERVTL